MNKNHRNIHAILQQRCLRHVSGVCIRNLTVPPYKATDADPPNATKGIGDLYFVIRVGHGTYESEHIKYCTNPNWLNFDIPKHIRTCGNKMSLQLLFKGTGAEPQVQVTWKLDLSKMAYIAEQLHQEELSFSPNALILKLCGSFYSLPNSFSTGRPHGNCPHFSIDEEKSSCNIFSLKRTITCHCSINQSKQRIAAYTATSNVHMGRKELLLRQLRQIENRKTHVKRLKRLVSREKSMLVSDQGVLKTSKDDVETRRGKLAKERFRVLQERDRFNEISDQLVIHRQRKDVFLVQLTSRRTEVLSELAYIFPIAPHVASDTRASASNLNKQPQLTAQVPRYSICGIFLPDAENLNVKDDGKNSVALGYVSQIVYMISYFMVIPIRYPLQLQGSQSSVVDHAVDKLQDRERTFPLHAKGSKDRFLFDYGVYLLNKNIGQMRFLLGVGTGDLRLTLHNLRTLLDRTFGVKAKGNQFVKPAIETVPEKRPQTAPVSNSPSKTTSEPPSNNIPRNSSGALEEKLIDKTVELHSLRGELFGGSKKAKSTPLLSKNINTSASPSRKQPVVTQHTVPPESPAAVIWSQADVNALPAQENEEPNAVFLTGLEDLEDQHPKVSAKAKKIAVVAARNELFSMKSGRSAYSKKHIHAVRAAETSHADNYFYTKEQVRKSTFATNGSAEGVGVANGDATDENTEPKAMHIDLDSSNSKVVQQPLASPEELDLC